MSKNIYHFFVEGEGEVERAVIIICNPGRKE